MSEPLYSRDILRLAVSIPHLRRLDQPDGTAEQRSKTCGSVVAADVSVDDQGRLLELGLAVNACALGQASAAILGSNALGKEADVLKDARDILCDYLDGNSESPGEWPDMDKLMPAKNHKGRHAAILLPYDAVIAALDDAKTKQTVA